MGLFKKDKIYFYIVTPADNFTKYLSVVTNKNDALRYVEKLLQIEHYSHYNLWRELRNLEDNDESWKTYLNTCIDDETKCKYVVSKVYYKQADLAAIIRMFCGCIPLGLPYDIQHEYLYLQEKLKNIDTNLAEDLQKAIEEDEAQANDLVN